jgi:hypothetical protein
VRRGGEEEVTQGVYYPRMAGSKSKINDLFELPNFKNVFAKFTKGKVKMEEIDTWTLTYNPKDSITDLNDPPTDYLEFYVSER